ncbi:TIGR01244 family sulfur transferase [Flavimaricola marinus]|uniref:Beta-lactamase hydrolase-like protein n=1 Tax=Flavimaricola marinus TaxID=1819565 RepID=A0A238LIM7_9RHOB|nr:TIGR01244 family sulfur transferase [Flavimaricola marinus]SMY09539.1 Beta-lactamase hydrolase-like protein [Flavimaricola marinus]
MKSIAPEFTVSGQIEPEDIGALKAEGYSTVICNRPDNEDPGQTPFSAIEAAAKAAGMSAYHIPIRPGQATAEDVVAFHKAVTAATGKVHAYCKSGGRAQSLYTATGR